MNAVYVARDDFRHHVITQRYMPIIGERMEFKARQVPAAVDAGTPPACECRHCVAER